MVKSGLWGLAADAKVGEVAQCKMHISIIAMSILSIKFSLIGTAKIFGSKTDANGNRMFIEDTVTLVAER